MNHQGPDRDKRENWRMKIKIEWNWVKQSRVWEQDDRKYPGVYLLKTLIQENKAQTKMKE